MSNDGSVDLNGEIAIITGAGGLLGREHTAALAGAGARLVLTDLHLDPCLELRKEFGDSAVVSVNHCDVSSSASWGQLVGDVVAQFGRIDILINNAAYTNQSPSPAYGAPFEDFPREDWEQILSVNLTGVFLGCQAVGRQMLAQQKGSIVNIASLYGVVSPTHRMYAGTGISQPPAYAVSKAGVIGLTKYLGALWAERGVRVNCITPGGIFNGQSDLFVKRFEEHCPAGRMGRPSELRGAIVFLASDAASYCCGHNLIIDGGWTAW